MRNIVIFLSIIVAFYTLITLSSGCAQIAFPTGGPTDSLAPVLTKAYPENNKLNFTGNKITLVFDEYIELKDPQTNLLVSPVQQKNLTIGSNLKTINIKIKDTLQPNTTYSINFGNAIADVHEGNILKDFTYTFSTGNYIDSFELKGKVLMAESGKADSTIMVYLYKNAVDSSVNSRKPDYITRVKGDGSFIFKNLPAAGFNVYALKDGDGGKTYNSKIELFAFADSAINTSAAIKPVTLYAYAEEKDTKQGSASSQPKRPAEKKLKYTGSPAGKTQDILQPLEIEFSNGLKLFDSTKIVVSDTNFKPLPDIVPVLDTNRKKLTVAVKWQPETYYVLILPKEAFTDSSDNSLEKTDTIRFATKKESDYGRLVIRFNNIDLGKHPVIQFLQNDEVKLSYPITATEWSNKLVTPGEYDVRILYDTNNNGKWDPGNYKEKRQPEHAVSLPQKLSIKADWDNEREIQL